MNYLTIFVFLIVNAHLGLSSNDGVPLLTQTIYGFLDFTTTIGNTVMVFSPQSAPPPLAFQPEVVTEPPVVIKTNPLETVATKEPESTISPTKLKTTSTTVKASSEETTTTKTKVTEAKTRAPPSTTTPANSAAAAAPVKPAQPPKIVTQSSPSPPLALPTTTSSSSIVIDNVVHDPEYDLLSRQPPQYVEENYRVVSLRPNNNKQHTRPAVVVTPEKHSPSTSSVLATKVTATALPSSSSSSRHKNKKHKIRPSSTLQVLKTAAPVQHPKINANSKASSHRSSSSSGSGSSSSTSSRKSSKKGHRGSASTTTSTTPQPQEDVVIVKSSTSRNKPKRKNKNKHSNTTSKPRYSSSATTTTTTEAAIKRAFKPKVQISNSDLESNNNLHITKLNRTPGRWQYKTSPKPRVSIRKPSIDVNGPLGLGNVSAVNVYPEPALNENINSNFLNQNVIYNQSDLDFEGSQNGAILNNIDPEGKQAKFFTETINVEISTPADFKDTYYEIATIKKPFIFQAGILKKTRYITVTSTIEKFLTSEASIEPRNDNEPLTENILAPSERPHSGILMGSISTLAPIYIQNESHTPVLETITESFSVVNQKLKTQILPIINEIVNETTYHTLVQTIDLTSLITVVKTVSPDMETKDFNGFQDFVGNLDEAGSEINLDLEFGDEGNHQESSQETNNKHLDLEGLGHINKTTAILPTLATDNQNPLMSNVITNSRPVIKLETLWESYVVPITNGQSTSYRTLSKAKGVVEKTEYIVETTTVPAPILPPTTINPFLLPQLQQFQTITSPVVQQTIVTQTQSKVLKLTFGAKTAYTTLYSTQVVPTVATTYVTTSVPVQPTANPFQGFYPPAYNPFAYLG
ncbi:uncharacterized protein LOC142238172 [Haematobia irritans]|uniref:uncharacterized protein LOC142238172 n=1 Tax=Haematobia irritans TaxID=7368 RepID=UPI003F4F966B